MIKAMFLLVSILPYPLRRDLRTNFYKYYFQATYAFKTKNLEIAEEKAELAYNTARNRKEAFLSLYLLGSIKCAEGLWSRAQYFLENALSLANTEKDSILIEPWLLYVYYYNEGPYGSYQLARSFNTNISEEKIFKGLYFINEERYDDALRILKETDNNTVYYMKGYIFYKKGMLDSAIYYISKITKTNNVEKLFYATLLYENGEYEKSHKIITKVEKDDVYSVLLQVLVESKLRTDALIKTYMKYKDIITNTPFFGAVSLTVAKMYFLQKNYRKVVDILNEAMPYMDTLSKNESLFYLGTSYIYLKRFASALKVWENYLDYPNNTHYDYAHFQLGRSAYNLELDSIAKEHLIRLHDTSAFYFWALYLYSRILLHEKSYSLAIPVLSYIASFNIERSLKKRVLYYLGKMLIKEKKWDSAIVCFKKVLDLGFKGVDIDTAEYLYEYARLEKGEYSNSVELNLSFSEKYPKNHMVPNLLDEAIAYFIAKGKIDSVYYVLLKRRNYSIDSIYTTEFKTFINMIKESDSSLLSLLIGFIKESGEDFEKIELAKRLIEIKKFGDAIDILQKVSDKNRREALFLISEAYNRMGKISESNLILNEIFPPFDSLGQRSFSKLALSILTTQGIDSFYELIFKDEVPDSLKIEVLRRASLKLFAEGDTLTALELKSRLKEIKSGEDTLEEH